MGPIDAAFAKAVTVPSVPASSEDFVKARQRFMASKAFRLWLLEALLIVDDEYGLLNTDLNEAIDLMLRSGLGDE